MCQTYFFYTGRVCADLRCVPPASRAGQTRVEASKSVSRILHPLAALARATRGLGRSLGPRLRAAAAALVEAAMAESMLAELAMLQSQMEREQASLKRIVFGAISADEPPVPDQPSSSQIISSCLTSLGAGISGRWSSSSPKMQPTDHRSTLGP